MGVDLDTSVKIRGFEFTKCEMVGEHREVRGDWLRGYDGNVIEMDFMSPVV